MAQMIKQEFVVKLSDEQKAELAAYLQGPDPELWFDEYEDGSSELVVSREGSSSVLRYKMDKVPD